MKNVAIEEMAVVNGGVGAQWYCAKCGWSAWHAFYNTAANNAYAHYTVTGHRTVTYYV